MIRIVFPLIAAILVLTGPAGAQLQIAADLDGDGVEDIAELIVNSQFMTADLLIVTAVQSYRFPEIVFSGGAEGQQAHLVVAPNGALEVHSGNLEIGRERWDQTLTVVWQDGAFRLVGVTRSWWDTLTPDGDGNCAVDLVTGRGLANGAGGTHEIRLEAPPPALADWDGVLPLGCTA